MQVLSLEAMETELYGCLYPDDEVQGELHNQ